MNEGKPGTPGASEGPDGDFELARPNRTPSPARALTATTNELSRPLAGSGHWDTPAGPATTGPYDASTGSGVAYADPPADDTAEPAEARGATTTGAKVSATPAAPGTEAPATDADTPAPAQGATPDLTAATPAPGTEAPAPAPVPAQPHPTPLHDPDPYSTPALRGARAVGACAACAASCGHAGARCGRERL